MVASLGARLSRPLIIVFLSALAAACGDATAPASSPAALKAVSMPSDRPEASWKVLSGPAQYVSGGDARVELRLARSFHPRLELWLNGRAVGNPLVPDGDRLEGNVTGMTVGENVVEARVDGTAVATLRVTNHPITGPIFSGPHQFPFVCTATTEYGAQPLVDSPSPPGFPIRDAANRTVGYSTNCTIDAYVSYWYWSTEQRWKPMPSDGSRPVDMSRTVTTEGRETDLVVRQERGTINRFLYSFAMLASAGEDPDRPDLSLWNRRLVYYFHGGVGVGRTQGKFHPRAMEPTLLGLGYAIAFSSGTNTGTHYNMPLAAETAMMTKERFIERYGLPYYTIGLGGSGGAIQQYFLAQNHPGIINGAVAVQSYPDMVTQTIHVGDCELLEHYMDVTDRDNANWRRTKRRSWLVGFNADDDHRDLYDPLSPIKLVHRYNASLGMSECSRSWRLVTPLVMNPYFGGVPNQEHMEPAGLMDGVSWTHWEDLRNIYGVDASGHPRMTWDNVGVQYGLASLKKGLISPAEFIYLNYHVGGWKHPRDMAQVGQPILGIAQGRSIDSLSWEVIRHRSRFDPWSRRNMTLSPGNAPAPRTQGDPIAMRAAYEAGLVFDGFLPIPTIDTRQYLERELDMHNARQSFVVRQRVLQRMGHSDHLVIWFTDTRPGVPKVEPWPHAVAVMDEWLGNLMRDPQRSIADNRPPRAVDACFDVSGNVQHAGPDAWDGVLDAGSPGSCTKAYPLYGTPRTVAGAPFDGAMFRCALKPVESALADGTYAPWVPNASDVAQLKAIFPDGVCDYGLPDQARP